MALTRDFKETATTRAKRDPAFVQALLDEALTLFLNGEPDTAKLMLRNLVNATVGFETRSNMNRAPATMIRNNLPAVNITRSAGMSVSV